MSSLISSPDANHLLISFEYSECFTSILTLITHENRETLILMSEAGKFSMDDLGQQVG